MTLIVKPVVPLERNAAGLFGLPGGHAGPSAWIHPTRISPADGSVCRVDLHQNDGLYPRPYITTKPELHRHDG